MAARSTFWVRASISSTSSGPSQPSMLSTNWSATGRAGSSNDMTLPVGSLNAVSQRREFHGALVRVDEGIGCLHPWPEFGDAPIIEQLQMLRNGGTSRVIERALCMAAVDGAARRRGMNLFEGLEIPPSHYSWDQNQPPEPQMRRVIREGWQAILNRFKRHVEGLGISGQRIESLIDPPSGAMP